MTRGVPKSWDTSDADDIRLLRDSSHFPTTPCAVLEYRVPRSLKGSYRRAGDIRDDHQSFAIDAVHPGADEQAKQEVGEIRRGGGNREIERRASQFEDHQRQRERGERRAEIGNGLAGPELPELGAQAIHGGRHAFRPGC